MPYKPKLKPKQKLRYAHLNIKAIITTNKYIDNITFKTKAQYIAANIRQYTDCQLT